MDSVGENHVSDMALFSCFPGLQATGNRMFKRVTYWPSCRMLSLIDGGMDGEERELGTSGLRGSARAHSVVGSRLSGGVHTRTSVTAGFYLGAGSNQRHIIEL